MEKVIFVTQMEWIDVHLPDEAYEKLTIINLDLDENEEDTKEDAQTTLESLNGALKFFNEIT